MTDLDDVRDLALCYLWTRQQLTERQAKKYRAWLNRTYKKPGTGSVSLDSALVECTEKLCQLKEPE